MTEEARNTVFDEFTSPIRKKLDEMGLKYEIKARVKSPYSIWNKMQNKHIPFEEIYDILAVRIIFEPNDAMSELNECFNIYVSISKIYTSHPDRIRDWVSHPKANGYQALHVTLMSNKGEWIEVQIRSQRMDEIAEKGFAAHWKYKDGDKNEQASESELDKWLTTIKEILDDPQPDAMDFLDTIKLNLFASEIFVFTPKGDIRTLPAGATALDFAFSIHTFVGSHCIGAKVNHKLVPMSHKLNSGDQVEILTSKSQTVKKSWLNVATTAKATTKIMAMLRKEERENRKKGETMLDEFFEREDIVKNTLAVEKLCKFHEFTKVDNLFVAIGQGKIQLGDADINELKGRDENSGWKKLFKLGKKSKKTDDTPQTEEPVKEKIDKKKPILLTEDTIQTKYKLADGCSPIPGDNVMGFIEDDGSITIHKVECYKAGRLKAGYGKRILAAKWGMHRLLLFPVNIYIQGLDRMGLLSQITQVISHLLNVNIRKFEIEANEGVFEGRIQLFVHDTTDVAAVMDNLKKIPDIKQVARF